MLYIEENGRIYGVEILEIDTDLTFDLTFGSPVVAESIALTRARVVIWYGPRDESGEIVKALRCHITTAASKNTLGAIEAEIRAKIIMKGL
jgi:hypothetical protein